MNRKLPGALVRQVGTSFQCADKTWWQFDRRDGWVKIPSVSDFGKSHAKQAAVHHERHWKPE